jgi:ornithine cyclodeaminase/alanine dehydrogenase-like protein (mu-crystallin family)
MGYPLIPATDPGVPMSTTAVIGLGILAWAVLAVLLALFVGRMIRIRDRQRPDRTESNAAEGRSTGGEESIRKPAGWRLRNKT